MTDSEADAVENFFGVYLLYCKNPKYIGRTYIGYTVNPNRRIAQHNKGKAYGGAWRTSNRGPWSMVMIIHGFPNDVSALQFEWAWQHPDRSNRLKHLPKKRAREPTYEFNFRILSEMLNVAPWCRLPLTVRWLDTEYYKGFPINRHPPKHMPIISGAVVSKKLNQNEQSDLNEFKCDSKFCSLCNDIIVGKIVHCINGSCDLTSHLICLSKVYLKSCKNEYIPIEGTCPKCKNNFLWGDIVRKYNGCYKDLDLQIRSDVGDIFYESD